MGALQQFVRRLAAGTIIGLAALTVAPASAADAQVDFVGRAASLLATPHQPAVADAK